MEPDIRDIVPMVKIEPIVVPERLAPTPPPQESDGIDPAKAEILKNFSVYSARDGIEASEIFNNNA